MFPNSTPADIANMNIMPNNPLAANFPLIVGNKNKDIMHNDVASIT